MYCSVDDCGQRFAPSWEAALLVSGARRRRRAGQRHPSAIRTIVIWFHQSQYPTFQAYSPEEVQRPLGAEFASLLSAPRFVERLPRILLPWAADLHTQLGTCTGLSFIDSTKLAVCHTARIGQHRVLAGRARRGQTSVGWFFGFKRHVVVNDRGERLAFCLTPGNVDDRRPVPTLPKRLVGKLFGDRGRQLPAPGRAALRGAGAPPDYQAAQGQA